MILTYSLPYFKYLADKFGIYHTIFTYLTRCLTNTNFIDFLKFLVKFCLRCMVFDGKNVSCETFNQIF